MTNKNLLKRLREKSQSEQKLTLEVIEMIRQVEERRLYLKLGYSSLFEFVTKDLGYENSSAMRRIQAARLVREIPEVKEKIQEKKLTLSVVSQAQSFFRKESKISGQKMSLEEKRNVLKRLENKSTREAEKEFVKIKPQVIRQTERVRELTEDLKEVKVVLDQETFEKLEDLRAHLSHQNPDLSLQGLIQLIVRKTHKQVMTSKGLGANQKLQEKELPATEIKALKTLKTLKSPVPNTQNSLKSTISSTQKPLKRPTSNAQETLKPFSIQRKSIPQKTKRYVWQRDNGQCQYVHPGSNKKCGSKLFLEIDHEHRVRHGGTNDPSNLRLFCRYHNQLRS